MGTHSSMAGMQNDTVIVEDSLFLFLMKLNTLILHNPGTMFCYFPKEVKIYVHVETCLWVLQRFNL